MSIGQALADAREKSGLSLEQVAAATRIRRTVIESIEHDDFAPCGGDFYARGHIRNIARTVGTDPSPLLAEYDSGHEAPDPGTPSKTIFETEVRPPRDRRMNWSAAMAVALVLILGFGIYRVITASPSATEAGTTAAPRLSASPSASAPRPTPRTSGSAVAQAPRSGVTVVVIGTGGKSWLSVRTGANKQAFQGVLASGQTRTFTDPKALHLTIGNAGAVNLVVNGRAIGHPGAAGKVIRVDFGPGDPATG